MAKTLRRLLLVRNDKLGDFMLAWPALALLKQHAPDLHISVLVPEYTAPMARLCPWIDELIIDPAKPGVWATLALARRLRAGRFDSMLTLFSTARVAVAGCLARIPYRLAPATKLAQLCYPQRLVQRRSRSEKPEYAYNLDLAWRLLADFGLAKPPSSYHDDTDEWLPASLPRPLLSLTAQRVATARAAFCQQQGLNPQAQLIFIHPGSGGSANNLSPAQYAQLGHALKSARPLAFVVTAGPGEEQNAARVATTLAPRPVCVSAPTGGLPELVEQLAFADLFISGSTGPLHIAGALDRPTAAFYPRHRSATPLRWQTLNAPHKRLAFTPPTTARADQVSASDISKAASAINQHFLSRS